MQVLLLGKTVCDINQENYLLCDRSDNWNNYMATTIRNIAALLGHYAIIYLVFIGSQ